MYDKDSLLRESDGLVVIDVRFAVDSLGFIPLLNDIRDPKNVFTSFLFGAQHGMNNVEKNR